MKKVCPNCNGSGKGTHGEVCLTCKGKGRV